MKLVSIHKQLLFFILLLISVYSAQAQAWTIKMCLDTALVHNKNLQISRHNIDIGEQKYLEVKATLIPKVTANADYKYFTNLPYQLMPLSTFNPTAPEGQFKEAQFGVPHNINANLQLSMPIYSPQIYGAIKTTEIAVELTKLQYQKTEEQLYFEIHNLYYNAQILQHQMEFIDSNLFNAKRLLKTIQLLNEQLLAKGTDVSKVKLQVSQLTTQRENISSKYIQVLNALQFTMGISIEKQIQIESNIEYRNTTHNDYADSSYTTLDTRIIKAQNQLILSELNTLHNSRFSPSLHLIGMYGTTGFGYDKQPNDFLKFYAIGFAGFQFSYPVFNGTVTQRKINQKRVELQNSDLQFGLAMEQNNMQVKNALMQRKVANNLVETNTEQIELAKTIYEQTILQQKQGTANLSDVLLADNALREAQQNYLTSIIEYLKADLELKKITGNISSKN